GSRSGGFTVERGSPRCSGTCWMPGSIWDGGMGGTADSFSSGIGSGVGEPLPSGGAGWRPSAEIASAGRRLRMAMAKNRKAVPDTLLVENKRSLLPHSCFDHDICTSSSLMTFEGSTYLRLSPHPLWAQRQGPPVLASRH